MPYITSTTALCGHEKCDPWQRRSSVLDEAGDVVLFNGCDGVRHLFRDNVHEGLLVTGGHGVWSIARDNAPDVPICTVNVVGSRRVEASHVKSGRCIIRHDTTFGALAKVARFYLRAQDAPVVADQLAPKA